jgi:hypothetical protein
VLVVRGNGSLNTGASPPSLQPVEIPAAGALQEGREETGAKVELAESHSAGQHCPRRRLQRPQQTMGHKMPSAAGCCFLGRRD